MSEFPIHTIESAPPASRAPLQGLQQEIGFVPNLAATMADSPTLIEAFTQLRTILGASAFSRLERETISLAVSVANDCSYCIAAHSTFAKMAGGSDADIDALRNGGDPADARLAALAQYTRDLLTTRGHASSHAQRALREAGFTRAQLLEVIAVVAFTTIANYAHNLSHCAIDAQFQ